jgi:hypothetical protein
MRSNNNHETITHLAMPERRIPVLIDAGSGRAEGFMPSMAQSGESVTRVRRLLPSFVKGLDSPQRRTEIAKEHGPIDTAEWQRLRELLALIDRLNAGDWSPVTTSNAEDALERLPALFDQLSHGGWLIDEDEPGTGKLSFRSASGDSRLTVDTGKVTRTPLTNLPSAREAIKQAKPLVDRDGDSVRISIPIRGTHKTAAFILSEAFTAGLNKTRFVIWWANLPKKLVPGLYCPDIVTALYASVLATLGTPGGLGVCQRCGDDFIRSRAKQLYCDHKCQVAAAMKRMRNNRKLKTETKSKATTKSKKRAGRK